MYVHGECSTTVHVSVLSFNDLSTYLIYIPFQYVVSFVTLLNCNILVEVSSYINLKQQANGKI